MRYMCQPLCIGKVPESRSVETGGIDIKYLDFDFRVTEAEFPQERIYLPNKLSSLHSAVNFHRVVTLHHIPQVLELLDPGERIPIEQYRRNISQIILLLRKYDALRFRFHRVWTGAELQVL